MADRIEIRMGPAADTVRAIPEREAFDFAFIDADKQGYPTYYELVLARTRPGGLIAVDNVLAGGYVVSGHPDKGATDQIKAIRETNELITAGKIGHVLQGQTSYYRVTAVDTSGNESAANIANAQRAMADTAAPAAPILPR